MRAAVSSLFLAAILTVSLVTVANAGHPVCAVTPGPGTDLTVSATGLARNTEYSMWWSISAVDDGPAFYYGGTSAHPSDHRGRWVGEAFTVPGYTGWWYIHISIPGTEFTASVVTCEFQT